MHVNRRGGPANPAGLEKVQFKVRCLLEQSGDP